MNVVVRGGFWKDKYRKEKSKLGDLGCGVGDFDYVTRRLWQLQCFWTEQVRLSPPFEDSAAALEGPRLSKTRVGHMLQGSDAIVFQNQMIVWEWTVPVFVSA